MQGPNLTNMIKIQKIIYSNEGLLGKFVIALESAISEENARIKSALAEQKETPEKTKVFKEQWCVRTKDISMSDYQTLLQKLKAEGYKVSSLTMGNAWGRWNYLGVNSYGDVLLYDNNHHFLNVDTCIFNNVCSKEWLEVYLLGR